MISEPDKKSIEAAILEAVPRLGDHDVTVTVGDIDEARQSIDVTVTLPSYVAQDLGMEP